MKQTQTKMSHNSKYYIKKIKMDNSKTLKKKNPFFKPSSDTKSHSHSTSEVDSKQDCMSAQATDTYTVEPVIRQQFRVRYRN